MRAVIQRCGLWLALVLAGSAGAAEFDQGFEGLAQDGAQTLRLRDGALGAVLRGGYAREGFWQLDGGTTGRIQLSLPARSLALQAAPLAAGSRLRLRLFDAQGALLEERSWRGGQTPALTLAQPPGTPGLASLRLDLGGSATAALRLGRLAYTTDTPEAVDDRVAVAEGAAPRALPLLENDDAAGSLLRIVEAGPSERGAGLDLAGDGSGLRYQPPAGFAGVDRFTYRVANAAGEDSAEVRVVVRPQTRVTFTQAYDQLLSNCSDCHSGPRSDGLPRGLDLSRREAAYENLVGVPSRQSGQLRVEPGRADRSWLVRKLEGTQTSGVRMPLGGPFFPQAEIDNLRRWIDLGAQDD